MIVTTGDEQKAGFAAVCIEIGMSGSAAVSVFAEKVAREGRTPFELIALPEGPTWRGVRKRAHVGGRVHGGVCGG